MSSTTPAPTDSSSVAASSTPQPTNSGSSGVSSSLYLFTFLATLFLLLSVSCAIVLRSYVLRRRLQRRLEESIRNGTALPPSSRSKSIGPKPVMWEVLLESRDDEPYDIKDWQQMKPISASIHGFKVDPSSDPSHEQSRSAPLASSPTTSQQPSSWRMFRKTRRRPPPSNVSPSQVEAQEFPLDAQEEGTMQVVTLVSMPAREKSEMYQTVKGKERTPASSGMFTGDLPDVVFGITEVPWNGGRT